MIFKYLLASFIASSTAQASSTAATIAEEYFSDGKYSKVISTCKEALEDDPNDKDCKNLAAKAKIILDKKNAANKANAEASQKQAAALQAEYKRKHDSPECAKTTALQDYCSTVIGIETEQAIIDRENRVAKDTGVVNMTAVNKAGRDKSYLEDQSASLATRYENRFHIKPTPSMCKFEKDTYGFPRADQNAQKRELSSVCGEN
jgi:hypothetical protein